MTEVASLVMRVTDPAASRRFYEAAGLELADEQHGSGPKHLSAWIGSCLVELYPAGDGAPSAGTRLGIRVDDLDDALARAAAQGIDAELVKRAGTDVAILRGPDGHVVELVARG